MALIGTGLVAEGAGGNTVTASKTSTAGSLIVGGAATWDATTARVPTIVSSLAGTYTKASDKTVNVSAERIVYGLSYNIGGTRGASHTLGETSMSGIARSTSFQEFDSVAASPTVTVGTEGAGTSTAPSCSVTVPSGTATVVAIMIYGGAATTATVANGTEISEADENSTFQDHFVAAKFGQSGTVTITWTLAASRQWACYAVAFSEVAGGTTLVPGAGALAITGPASTLSINPTPPSGALAISGQSNTLVVGGTGSNTNATPAAGALVFTGTTSLLQGLVFPSTGTLVLHGEDVGSAFQGPDEAGMVLTGTVPTLQQMFGMATAGAVLTLTGTTSTPGITYKFSMPAGSLTISGPTATVASSSSPVVGNDPSSLSLTGQSITLLTPLPLSPPSGSLRFTGNTPLAYGVTSGRGMQGRGRKRDR